MQENACALRRIFGTAEKPFLLEFRRYRPGDRFQLLFRGKEVSGLMQREAVTIEYGSLAKDKDSQFQAGSSKPEKGASVPAIFLSSSFRPVMDREPGSVSPDMVTPAMEDSIRQIALVWGSNRLVLDTGSLDKPFAAMRSCTDEMVKRWGLDPATQNSLSRRARPAKLASMVRSIQAVYPMSMAVMGKQGRVNFRALVDAQGVVTGCETVQSYNDAAFDALACKVIQKTAFEPALDKDGKPTASYYAETVIYSMN
ncbi:energy transducer TonB [Novosphingobium kaempferiae]|uniref:energy transducer TonB n=1 Tax=Novosphingobium kaempferiae TaxID=2896849 RepID=UPI001E5C4B33|nr:energy transducer TonB [Novosphingobium kaempferiae]